MIYEPKLRHRGGEYIAGMFHFDALMFQPLEHMLCNIDNAHIINDLINLRSLYFNTILINLLGVLSKKKPAHCEQA